MVSILSEPQPTKDDILMIMRLVLEVAPAIDNRFAAKPMVNCREKFVGLLDRLLIAGCLLIHRPQSGIDIAGVEVQMGRMPGNFPTDSIISDPDSKVYS